MKWTKGPVSTFTQPPGAPALPGGATPASIQQASTNYYSGAEQAVTNVNALGEKVISLSDALGRETRFEVRNGTNGLVRERSRTYLANHHGVFTTNGSGANAIVTAAYTDNTGTNVLAIEFPAAAAKEFTRKSYDAAGNVLLSVHASSTNGSVVEGTSASFVYDGLNRAGSHTSGDGTVTLFDFHAANNVTNKVLPGQVQWRAKYKFLQPDP